MTLPPRTKVLTIRLTRREAKAFAKAAAHHGKTMSVAARELFSHYVKSTAK